MIGKSGDDRWKSLKSVRYKRYMYLKYWNKQKTQFSSLNAGPTAARIDAYGIIGIHIIYNAEETKYYDYSTWIR